MSTAHISGPALAADALREATAAHADALVGFVQRLIQTPSPTGGEGALAALVQREMGALGYDDVWVDTAGNVVGCVRGGNGASLMLNTHLDHVDPGDPARWPVDPYGGVVRDGAVWGRGAMDIKGPLACQVYTPAVLRQLGVLPPGDLYVTCVVMEEIGGVGARVLTETLRPDAAVVGEATGCGLARGHRGRLELQVVFTGRSAHASMPDVGANPHYAAARLLDALAALPMVDDPELGPATVAPTLVATDQASPNVIPEQLTLTLDWRTVPAEPVGMVVERVQALADAASMPGVRAEVRVRSDTWHTYSGLDFALPSVAPAFRLPTDNPLLVRAEAALTAAYGAPVPVFLWRFATDGGHFSAAGIPTLGFGPGDDRLAHTTEERIAVDALFHGLMGNSALAVALGEMNA